jgi:hypothetical protein
MRILLVAIALIFITGCETVQPWERGTLAKPEMQWQTDVMEDGLHSQIQYSKEASSGGAGAAGGGCGCN